MALLEIDELGTRFETAHGPLTAVDRLSFSVNAGETVAIVGESGSGKSVTAMSIMRLLATPPARHSGAVRLDGIDLLTLPDHAMRHVRGERIGMIFQEPMTALNPVLTIGHQLTEGLKLHRGLGSGAAKAEAIRQLKNVGIPAPERRYGEYPHQLSGGMRQRVMIAMALACDPALLIADEPTTALDVTVQAQILDLIRRETARRGMAVILITHDLGVVADLADRVVILYAGRKVEEGTTRQIFTEPYHPYTKGLLGATPRLGSSLNGPRGSRLMEIAGNVPVMREPAAGCSFAPRCAHATDMCGDGPPSLRGRDGHVVACGRFNLADCA
jgi:peptide/nickel transport system ATP-binding protein